MVKIVQALESMAYSIRFEHDEGTLVARVTGERPAREEDAAEAASRGWTALAREARAQGALRLLVVVDVQGEATSSHALLQAARMSLYGFDRRQRLACVFLQPRMYQVNRLGTLLAAEQGWDMRSFQDEAQARAWLGRA